MSLPYHHQAGGTVMIRAIVRRYNLVVEFYGKVLGRTRLKPSHTTYDLDIDFSCSIQDALPALR